MHGSCRAVMVPAALTLAMASVAIPLVAVGGQPFLPLGVHVPSVVLVALLAVAFAVAELALLHVEFRSQAYSYAMAGVPLVIGLAICGPRETLLARVLGTLVAFAIQRPALLKAAYNLSAYAFEVALGGYLLHRWGTASSQAGRALTVALTVAAVDQLIGVLVLVVIMAHGSRLTVSGTRRLLVPAVAFSLASSALALMTVLLLRQGWLGVGLVLAGVGGVSVLHRSYRTLHRRHRALALVHSFVEHAEVTDDLDQAAARLLARTRTLLSAARAEMLLEVGGQLHHLALDGDGSVTSTPTHAPHDWLVRRVLEQDEPILAARSTRDSGLQRWLDSRGAAEAMVVALPLPEGSEGIVCVYDRLGETSGFTAEDLTMLQTVAGHMAVALQNTELVSRLQHAATHDVLTGLSNRALLAERLGAALRAQRTVSLLMFDLDRFKEVNDAFGHDAGDELLRVVAGRVARQLPVGSLLARLGGDEFAVLLPADGSYGSNAEVAEAMLAVLSDPIELQGGTIVTQASVGIAVAGSHELPADVMRHADTAMYAAKRTRARVVSYTEELDRGRVERLALLADLQIGLVRGEVELYYQPQLSLATGRIVGVEALARWRHPRLGMLMPDVFVPLAESGGLIDTLTEVVLTMATAQCQTWRVLGIDASVAVNLSARNINDPGIVEVIQKQLADSGLPADRLVIEITEGSVMEDAAQVLPTLNSLVALGVSLSLDDFGTGYSSLAYLQRLPVAEIKIDRSFVAGLRDPEEARASLALTRSIVALGKSLGLTVVAEGVEDADTLELLRELGCSTVQGYHVCRPCEPAALTSRLLEEGVQLPGRRLTAAV